MVRVPAKAQRRLIAALGAAFGGIGRVLTIDAGDEVMLTHPTELAAMLVELVRH